MKFFLSLAVFIALAVVSNAFHFPKIHRMAISRRSHAVQIEESSVPAVELPVEPTETPVKTTTPRGSSKKGGKMWDMNKCVYFGNLPADASEEKVKNFIYNHIGPERLESIKLIVDKNTGSSKGYAYINFKNAEDASGSLQTLSELVFEGNPVKVTPRIVRTEDEVKRDFGQLPRVYIANLDWGTNEDGLTQLVEEKLEATNIVKYVKIGRDDFGRSKGYAHIELSTPEQVDLLIERLNGFHGGFKPLIVERAGLSKRKTTPSKPQNSETNKSFQKPKRRTSDNKEAQSSSCSIFLGNLSWSVSKELLDEMLTDVLGPDSYLTVRLAKDSSTGNHRGFAHIDFKDEESAERAISELNGMELLNRVLRADRADSRGKTFRKGGNTEEASSQQEQAPSTQLEAK